MTKGPKTIKILLRLGLLFGFLALGFWFYFSFFGIGTENVMVEKTPAGGYRLLVNGRPYLIKGVCYNPAPVGVGYDYELGKDKNKPWLADGELMREAGVNTIRLYTPGTDAAGLKEAISDLYRRYGIRTILGHWLGFWEYPQPDYCNPEFREKVKRDVLDMVRSYKDEAGILFWLLGNENNYSFSGRINPWNCPQAEGRGVKEKIDIKARTYYSFVNELAAEIHKIDPNHPVAMGNGELLYLDTAARLCPDVDIIGSLVYRGRTFGNIFNYLKKVFDRPLVFIEFGADAYNSFTGKEDEKMQAFFLQAQWKEIFENSAFGSRGDEGNCLGGVVFEWTDEWWKHEPDNRVGWNRHDTGAGWSNGSYYLDIKAEKNMNMNEEWFGIVGVSDKVEDGINKRRPRQAYYTLQGFWKKAGGEKK
ncbi:MAG: hypothetical protein ACE5GG_02825 [Candidatus Omnitrophota bacterium]